MSFVIFLLTLFYDANIITKKDKHCNYFRKKNKFDLNILQKVS